VAGDDPLLLSIRTHRRTGYIITGPAQQTLRCSGSGLINRHPGVLVLVSSTDTQVFWSLTRPRLQTGSVPSAPCGRSEEEAEVRTHVRRTDQGRSHCSSPLLPDGSSHHLHTVHQLQNTVLLLAAGRGGGGDPLPPVLQCVSRPPGGRLAPWSRYLLLSVEPG